MKLDATYTESKARVAAALSLLDAISGEIHERRRRRQLGLPDGPTSPRSAKIFNVLVLPPLPTATAADSATAPEQPH